MVRIEIAKSQSTRILPFLGALNKTNHANAMNAVVLYAPLHK